MKKELNMKKKTSIIQYVPSKVTLASIEDAIANADTMPTA